MPVQYQPYKSMYVSQRSPEIAKTLRDRFVQNFAAQDNLKQQLLELETAPFAGDEKAKEQLAEEVRSKLNELSERGDYENLTMQVVNTARDYQNRATPLAKNAQLYNTDKAEKEQLLQQGKITLADYNGWLKKASMQYDPEVGDYKQYAGVQFDDNGNPIQGSYYSSTPIAQFVDVQGEILKQLNTLDKVKEGGYTVQGYQTQDGVEYAITKGDQIVEYISPERVKQVTQGVLSRADVQSYMNQEAEFAVLDADADTLDNELAKYATQLKSQGNTVEAAKLEDALYSGTPGQKRQAVQQLKMQERAGQYMNMGISAKAIRSAYGGSFAKEYSAATIAAMKNKGETVHKTPMFYGEAEQIPSVFANDSGVVTPQSINENKQRAQTSVNTALETLKGRNPSLAEMGDQELMATINSTSYENLGSISGDVPEREFIQAKQAIDAAAAITQAAKRAEDIAYRTAEYTPDAVTNSAIAEISNDLGVEANTISNQYLRLLQPGAPGFEASPEEAYLGTAEKVMQSLKESNLTPGGDLAEATADILVKMTGISLQEARDISFDAMDNVVVTPITSTANPNLMMQGSPYDTSVQTNESRTTTRLNDGLNGFVDNFMDTYIDIARERSRSAAEELINVTSGVISFGESDYAIGADKKKSEEFVKAMTNRTLSDFQQAQVLNGEPLYNALANEFGVDPEDTDVIQGMLQNYSIDKVAFTRGVFENAQVEPVLEITAKGPEDDQRKFKLRYDQVVAAYEGFDSDIMGYYNTPADYLVNSVYTELLSAPGAAKVYGVDYTFNDPNKGNFTFNFVPRFGANNTINGFREVLINGVRADGTPVNTRVTEQEFFESYNSLVNE